MTIEDLKATLNDLSEDYNVGTAVLIDPRYMPVEVSAEETLLALQGHPIAITPSHDGHAIRVFKYRKDA